jgi:hypothetical protein
MVFAVGTTYQTRSACDYDCILSLTVAARTAKTLTTAHGKTLRIRAGEDGVERVMPWGRYSMAPVISADRERVQ